jgi:hypothetical protein
MNHLYRLGAVAVDAILGTLSKDGPVIVIDGKVIALSEVAAVYWPLSIADDLPAEWVEHVSELAREVAVREVADNG